MADNFKKTVLLECIYKWCQIDIDRSIRVFQ